MAGATCAGRPLATPAVWRSRPSETSSPTSPRPCARRCCHTSERTRGGHTPAPRRAATSPSRSTSTPRRGWRPSSPSAPPRSPSTRRTAGWSRRRATVPSGSWSSTRSTAPARRWPDSSPAASRSRRRRSTSEPTMGDVQVGCVLELKSGAGLRRRARPGPGAGRAAVAKHARWSGCSGPTASAGARRAR